MLLHHKSLWELNHWRCESWSLGEWVLHCQGRNIKMQGHSAMTWMTDNLHRQMQWLLNAALSLGFICMISKLCLKSSVRLSQIWPFSSSQGQTYWRVTGFSAFSLFMYIFILYPLNTFNRPGSCIIPLTRLKMYFSVCLKFTTVVRMKDTFGSYIYIYKKWKKSIFKWSKHTYS